MKTTKKGARGLKPAAPKAKSKPKAKSAGAAKGAGKAKAGGAAKRPAARAKSAALPRDMVPSKDGAELIHDWNADGARPTRRLELVDETLRDGLQCPSVTDPPIEKKIEILRLMVALGIQNVDIGLPGAGGVVNQHVETLLRVIKDEKLPIRANCAARTVVRDIAPVAEIQQRVGHPLAVSMFIGSSAIRQYAENWTLDKMLQSASEALAFARKEWIPIIFVTEDTTRAHPKTIAALYNLAMDFGAKSLIACDTCGHATPSGVTRLVKYVKGLVAKRRSAARVEWHGHMDRGLGVINSIAAAAAGADRIHGTGLGIGERAGNTPLEEVVMAIHVHGEAMGVHTHVDTRGIHPISRKVAERSGIGVAANKAVVGRNAFRHASGIHQDGVVKFRETYEVLDPAAVGNERGSEIVLGKLSGRAGFRARAAELGMVLADHELDAAFERFQEIADRSREVGDDVVRDIVRFARGEAECHASVA